MAAIVSVSFTGTAEQASAVMEHLRDGLEPSGGRLTVEDPSALGAGGGNLALEFDDLDAEAARTAAAPVVDALPADAGRCEITAVQ